MNLFEIPEIIDCICNFLTVVDMFELMQVNHTCNQIIESNYYFKGMKLYYYKESMALLKGYFEYPEINRDVLKLCYYNNENILRDLYYEYSKGDFKMIKYLCLNYHQQINTNLMFELNCIHGYFEIAKWLYNKFKINLQNNYYIFKSISNGHLNVAKWIYEINNIHIDEMKSTFRRACEIGHLEAVKWLYGLDTSIDIDIGTFRITCCKGHLELAQYLYSLGIQNCIESSDDIMLNATTLNYINYDDRNYDVLFSEICMNGHLEIAKWLYGLKKINIHIEDELIFRWSCVNGYLDMAKWLYSLDGLIDIHIHDESVFQLSYYSKRYDVIDWLCGICSDYYLEVDTKELYYKGQKINVWSHNFV